MEENKIGEVFEFEGAVLQAIKVETEDMTCGKCYFNSNKNCDDFHCLPSERTDKKNVQFKKISKTMITREQAKELLPILQAFAEGKQIQDKIEGVTDWVDTDKINFEYEGQKIKHRIKPESNYRPFKNQEECWNEMHKHSDIGWIINKSTKSIYHINVIYYDCIYLDVDKTSLNYLEAFDYYEFLDGAPFGVKEE